MCSGIGTELFSEYSMKTTDGMLLMMLMVVKTHAWVNVDLMMDGCMIGFMVRE